MSLQEAHLRYQDGLLVRLALRMHEESGYSRARACILADALLEAGCDDPLWQRHLRYDMDHSDEWRTEHFSENCTVVLVILREACRLGLLQQAADGSYLTPAQRV